LSQIRASDDSRFYDLLMGSPLILLSGFALSGFVILIPQQWRAPHTDYPLILSEVATALFLSVQLVLVCIRRLPINKITGFWPKAWAFVGSNAGYALLLFPRTALGPNLAVLSTLIIIAGTLASLITLIWLGRAFAIFPQARTFVTRGPYAYVRHPLYLSEQLAMLGVALQYRQPWGLLVFVVSFGLQFPRMHYEEVVLAATFAEYGAYTRSTPRLIPLSFRLRVVCKRS